MRDFTATCFGDDAVRVAQSFIQNSVTYCYRTTLSSPRQELLIEITWTNANGDSLGSLVVRNHNESNSQMLRRRKFSRSFAIRSSVITLHYDLSSAKRIPGPEPINDFYLVLICEAHLCLLIGDKCSEFCNKLEQSVPKAKFRMFSRKELVMNTGFYSTKACFKEGGKDHEVVIRCKGDEWDRKGSELSVYVDKLRVVSVQRLQWNFRGNQTVFVEEGFAVDVMWDVHDLWFCEASRSGFFVFRTRSTWESRLWCDEELARNVSAFSLIIQFCKS